MKQLKKTILTLVALLAVTTGAWAKVPTFEKTIFETTETLSTPIYVIENTEITIAEGATVTINGGLTIAEGKTLTVTGPGTLVVTGAKGNDGSFGGGNGGNGGVAISGNIIVQGGATVTATGGNGGNGGFGVNPGTGANGGAAISGNVTVQGGATVTATGGNGGKGGDGDEAGGKGGNGGNAIAGTLTYKSGTVTANGGSGGTGGSGETSGSSGSAGKAFANPVDFTQTTVEYTLTDGSNTITAISDQKTVVISGGSEPASASAVTVDWNKTTKTGTFSMPGGNVELEPEYYPQAALTAAPTAINDVPATTDGDILKAGTVATIGSTEQAQGTVMYYVSPTALDDAALLALAADQWKADVPTAESLAQGQAYVYYYVRGNDSDTDDETFSDGDILSANALTVTIAPEPTYNVEFAEGTPEPDKWSADPNAGVTKGQTVTVTYSGTRKVIGVKAEKKSGDKGKSLAEATVGMIVGSNGKAYEADDKDNLPDGVNTVAKVCYVDGNGHGLAMALADEGQMNWSTAQSTCAAHTPAITGGTWKLATKDEWQLMINAAGGFNNLKTGFSSVGGTDFESGGYWANTEYEYDAQKAYIYYFSTNMLNQGWKDGSCFARACLAF